jgi:hypothetical protein
MGRSILNATTTATTTATKLVATGEYVMTQVSDMGNQTNYTIWTYNYSKQRSASESYLYMSAQFNSLEAYSYAPAPCIRCSNQTSDLYNGSQYFWGMTGGSEREFNIYSCQNFAHAQTLNGLSANISSGNFGVGTVPIIIRWESADGNGNRPGWNFCPNKGGSYSSVDNRGQTNWYGYLRVWEILY